MPSYKFDSESDSEPKISHRRDASPVSDDGEPGPDDTFHFRQSFSKQRAPLVDEDMDDPSFQTDEPEEPELSYDEMGEDFSELESIMVTDEEPQYEKDPLATAVRIEKRATWLEQIEYTDRAVKRLKAINSRERVQNSKVHWGGRIPEMKYSVEDLARDLFGETKVYCVDRVGANCRRRKSLDLTIYKPTL
jgi:hypothetical protein